MKGWEFGLELRSYIRLAVGLDIEAESFRVLDITTVALLGNGEEKAGKGPEWRLDGWDVRLWGLRCTCLGGEGFQHSRQ